MSLGQRVVKRRDVAVLVAELARSGEHLVRRGSGRERQIDRLSRFEREPDVFLHHPHVEPGLIW